jgi:hypothetical protein
MTGPLVGVTVLQPASGTAVLPGQSVTCSGRATGHGGVQTTLVDSVVLNLNRGSDIEADLSPVVPKPTVPAVNWAASVAAPDQPGPHYLTITAFPDDDGGAPARVTVGFVVQEPTPPPDSVTVGRFAQDHSQPRRHISGRGLVVARHKARRGDRNGRQVSDQPQHRPGGPGKVTVAFLVAIGAAESGQPTLIFQAKEAIRLALQGVATVAARPVADS